MSDNILSEKLSGAPNKKWEDFILRFEEIKGLEIKEWKPVHLIGYFISKYKNKYNLNYQLKFNSPAPSKSFEIFQIKRLCSILTSNPILLKEYIDWVFVNKVPLTKKRFTSISFLTKEETMSEYKMTVLFASQTQNQINRSMNLPANYLEILESFNLPLKTYGDLAFAVQEEPLPQDLELALLKMSNLGFDQNSLHKIV